jgi:prevent-host-death family protein
MRVAVTNNKGQLTELIRQAEAEEEIILTRHGKAAVRLAPVEAAVSSEARRKLLEAIRASGAVKARSGENAARSQDFLYGPDGFVRMIAVDTSALMAIVLGEDEADACIGALAVEAEIVISAGTVAEALIVAARRNVGEETL